ncbi:MAG: hypothetical protein HRT52_07845 [Colwellia sp.]|nr:hypothetical protein [Colwellia sp.]
MKDIKRGLLSLLSISLMLNSLHINAQERNVKRYNTKQYNNNVVVAPKRTNVVVTPRRTNVVVAPRHANVVVVPRHRSFNNVVIIRPHGHAYIGYGSYHNDNDAWKWLAFTAITLKVLDNINEEAQRKHESAQVSATTAQVGEKITWHDNDSSGYVMTTKEGTNASGLSCREFQQEITVGGKTEQAYGTACLQADGAWKIMA